MTTCIILLRPLISSQTDGSAETCRKSFVRNEDLHIGLWLHHKIDEAGDSLKLRRGGRIVSVAVIIAVGVNTDSRREVLGMEIGTSEAEAIWTEFLRKLTRRRMRGVKLVVSDAHEGKSGRRVVSALLPRPSRRIHP